MGKGIPGRGVAAIAEDFTTFVALDSHQLQVYAARRDHEGFAILEAHVNTGIKAEWISLIESQVFLLAPEGAGTQLRVFTRAAKPVYSLTVPIHAPARRCGCFRPCLPRREGVGRARPR